MKEKINETELESAIDGLMEGKEIILRQKIGKTIVERKIQYDKDSKTFYKISLNIFGDSFYDLPKIKQINKKLYKSYKETGDDREAARSIIRKLLIEGNFKLLNFEEYKEVFINKDYFILVSPVRKNDIENGTYIEVHEYRKFHYEDKKFFIILKSLITESSVATIEDEVVELEDENVFNDSIMKDLHNGFCYARKHRHIFDLCYMSE